MAAEVEFMIRVRLPNPSGYASCPSGDTDYEVAYDKAMKKALPKGFVVMAERPAVHRPTDGNGLTWVRVRPTTQADALHTALMELGRLKAIIEESAELANKTKGALDCL